MAWLQLPKFRGGNARLLFAMQLAEKASIAHQRLLAPGSLKCDIVRMAEANGAWTVRVEVEAEVEVSRPPSPSGPVPVSDPVPDVVEEQKKAEETTTMDLDLHLDLDQDISSPEIVDELSLFFVDEGQDGSVSVTDASTGEDYGEIYHSLF
jgi:hypothetical protein